MIDDTRWCVPIVPEVECVSPVMELLDQIGAKYELLGSMVSVRGFYATIWPDRDGKYGIAAGSPQYAIRRDMGRYELGKMLWLLIGLANGYDWNRMLEVAR